MNSMSLQCDLESSPFFPPHTKRPPAPICRGRLFSSETLGQGSIVGLAHLVEAVAAVHGTVAAGLEGDLGGSAAVVANHVVHGAIGAVLAAGLATAGPASGAAAGLVLEALVGVELLLGSGENELAAAVPAGQSLVFEHGKNPPKIM